MRDSKDKPITCLLEGDEMVVRIPASLARRVLLAIETVDGAWAPAWVLQAGTAIQPSQQVLLYRPSETPVAMAPQSLDLCLSTGDASPLERPNTGRSGPGEQRLQLPDAQAPSSGSSGGSSSES